MEAFPGQFLDSCGWEYFTYRFGADGNCGDACPSGLFRIIAMAETNNGPYHPLCYGPMTDDLPHELARIQFFITANRTYQGLYLPVKFFWGDCGDNTISDVDGDTLYLDRCVRDFQENVIWDELDDENYPEEDRIPFVGALDACILDTSLYHGVKTQPVRCICYRFGGFDVIPDTSIDVRGDINCNGIPNEIADAVMLINYFISGLSAFDNHVEASIAASDANNDGIALTVADLVYLIRVMTGDAQPYPKLAPNAVEASVGMLVNHSAAGVAVTSTVDLGAGYFVFDYSGYEIGEPQLINGASGMSVKYGAENGQIKVLVYSFDKDAKIAAGTGNIFVIPIHGEGTISLRETQLADYYGNSLRVATGLPALPTAYDLHQKYPNPFNAATTILYELPAAGHVTIDVFNVLGQKVTTLMDAEETAGIHSAVWNGTDERGNVVSSGMYLYRMTAGDFTAEKKMVLLK